MRPFFRPLRRIPLSLSAAVLLAGVLAAGCTSSRLEVETQQDHSFVDVAYDSTHFNMLVRKDTIDRNDNNVMFWGVNNLFAPTFNPAMQSLYFSLESNYRDERDRYFMEWNLDSRGTAGSKHRLIHGMIPKETGFGQLLELRWNHYLFKKAFGDAEYLSIKEDGMTINTPMMHGSRDVAVIGNACTINWDAADIFTVTLPKDGARGFDAGKALTVQFEGKNSNQTITLYVFSGDQERTLSWGNQYGGVPLYWKDGTVVDLVPAQSIAEFTVSRIMKAANEHVYLASLKGMYREP